MTTDQSSEQATGKPWAQYPDPPYADIPALLERAQAIIEAAGLPFGVAADQWKADQQAWLDAYAAALPALQRPYGAVFEIIEDVRPPLADGFEPHDPNAHPAVTVPNRISINGMPLLISHNGPVVERIDTRINERDAAIVTVQVFARRVRIDAERAAPAPPDGPSADQIALDLGQPNPEPLAD